MLLHVFRGHGYVMYIAYNILFYLQVSLESISKEDRDIAAN